MKTSEPLDLSVSLMPIEDKQIRMYLCTESSKTFGFCLSSRPYMDFRARVVSWSDAEHGASECRVVRTVNLAMTSDTFPRTLGYYANIELWTVLNICGAYFYIINIRYKFVRFYCYEIKQQLHQSISG